MRKIAAIAALSFIALTATASAQSTEDLAKVCNSKVGKENPGVADNRKGAFISACMANGGR